MKKIFSIVLSLLLIFSMFISPFSEGMNAYAEENSVLDIFRSTLDEAREKEGNLIDNDSPKADETVTFIIEIDENSAADLSDGEALSDIASDEIMMNKIKESQNYYIEEIKKINPNAVISNQYTLLINGFSVETKFGDKNKIEEIHGVKNVELSKKYYRDSKNAVKMTQISKVWEDYGYDGTGKVVAVIDSGVDYTHKDMRVSDISNIKLTQIDINKIRDKQLSKRGKWFSDKIPFGYNYADKNDNIRDTVVENIDYCHGMHVAGIIGANCQSEEEIELNKGVRGVAPECQILAMKIFSNDPKKLGAGESDIIAAIEDSVAYGADVINMSFCITAGFQDPSEGQQKAIQTAINEGVIVVSAAGNSAYSNYPMQNDVVVDNGTVGAPGLANGTIQVASLENSIRVTYGLTAKIGTSIESIAYVLSDFDPIALTGEYELVDCGLARVEDLEGKDLTGKIALIKRGIIEFKDKKLNVQAKGAVGAIIYNSDGDESYLNYISTDPKVNIPTMVIKNSDGVKLKENIEKGLKVSFNGKEMEVSNLDSGEMSYYSSWGPTPNLDFKPDVTSIGGNVWSTVNDNKYKSMTGTSMASPNTAGIMLLYLQHLDSLNITFDEPSQKVNFAKTMLMNTSEVQYDKLGVPYSPRLQGAGLVNAKKTLENNVSVTYYSNPSIALKEIGPITEIPLVLRNYGDKDITYRIETIGKNEANLNFDKSEITVKAGQSTQISGELLLGNDISINDFVEGFIRFVPVGQSVPELVIPFLGFYGDWGSLQIVDTPKYNGNSVYGETTLVTAKQSTFGYKTYQLGGKDVNPEYFAINPEDKKANCNVLPQFSLLRNAKEIKIDITNDEGEIIKVLEDKEKMRKEIILEQQISAKVNFDWLWEGGVYDKNLGHKKIIEEGQYYVNIRAKADYENAKEQITTFPLKIDKTPPTIKSEVFFTDNNECVLELEAMDNGIVNSDIENFLFLIDGKKYVDDKDNSIFNLEKSENGKYKMCLKLPEENKKLIYTIDIGVTDHADNMAAGKAYVVYSPKSNIDIKTDKENYNLGENITVNYQTMDVFDKSKLDHYEICVNSLSNVLGSTKDMNFIIKRLLNNGVYRIFVKAVDVNGKVLDINGVSVVVGNGITLAEDMVVQNLTEAKNIKNGENFVAKIKALNFSKENEDVTLIVCLYDKDNRLINSTAVEKNINSGKVGYLTTSVKIPETGIYKLKLFVWDNIDEMNSLLPFIEFNMQVE